MFTTYIRIAAVIYFFTSPNKWSPVWSLLVGVGKHQPVFLPRCLWAVIIRIHITNIQHFSDI